MEIKKELNDMYKVNFNSIEKKNYDNIISITNAEN